MLVISLTLHSYMMKMTLLDASILDHGDLIITFDDTASTLKCNYAHAIPNRSAEKLRSNPARD